MRVPVVRWIDWVLLFPFQRLAHAFQRASGGRTNFWLANWFFTLALFASLGATVRVAFLFGGIPAHWFFLEATLVSLLFMFFRLNGKAEDDEVFRKERIQSEHTRPRVLMRLALLMIFSKSLYTGLDEMFFGAWEVLHLYISLTAASLIAGFCLNACVPLSGSVRGRE